jgi:hypothetical protein
VCIQRYELKKIALNKTRDNWTKIAQYLNINKIGKGQLKRVRKEIK